MNGRREDLRQARNPLAVGSTCDRTNLVRSKQESRGSSRAWRPRGDTREGKGERSERTEKRWSCEWLGKQASPERVELATGGDVAYHAEPEVSSMSKGVLGTGSQREREEKREGESCRLGCVVLGTEGSCPLEVVPSCFKYCSLV